MLLLRGSKAPSMLRHSGFCCYDVSLCTKGLSPPSFSSFESLQYCLVWVFSSKVAREERYLSSLILFSVLSLLWFVWYFFIIVIFLCPCPLIPPAPIFLAYLLVSLASVTLCSCSRLPSLCTPICQHLGRTGKHLLAAIPDLLWSAGGLRACLCFSPGLWMAPPALSGRQQWGGCPFPGSLHHSCFGSLAEVSCCAGVQGALDPEENTAGFNSMQLRVCKSVVKLCDN